MPYVQRDFNGNIVGLYADPQSQQPDGTFLTEPDPLPDDHPEVVQFLSKFPPPAIPVQMQTPEEAQARAKEYERLSREQAQLQNLMLRHFQAWSELELSLSGLFQETLNIQPIGSMLARTAYFSLGGFDQRIKMLSDVLQQFTHERTNEIKTHPLQQVIKHWIAIRGKITSAKNFRNVVAHGSIIQLPHGNKLHIRVAPPAFDPIKFMVPLKKGTLVGYGIGEFQEALKRIEHIVVCTDCLIKCISSYLQFGEASLTSTLDVLTRNVEKLNAGP